MTELSNPNAHASDIADTPLRGRCEHCGCLKREHVDFIARVFGDKEYCALKSEDELLYERKRGTDGGY